MTFLNLAMLAGLAAVAIPIVIHLLNRQRATLVDWGAMRFLMESMTSRSRRILIEEIILMAMRCLAVALMALVLARPFLPTQSSVPWAMVLPAILGAAMLLGIAIAAWSYAKTRWILLACAAGLAGVAVLATMAEAAFQGKLWSKGGGERDVVLLIDGSASMTVPIDGQTNFQRAVEEAKAVVEACRPADAISLFVAGPTPHPIVGSPTADRQEILKALAKLAPSGGSMRALDALMAAGASLAQGHNPVKKIVLLTDGQNIGWDARNEARWQFLAAGLKDFPTPPQIVCRMLAMPRSLRNAAAGEVRLSRQIIGIDRSVKIDVTVMNTGSTPLESLGVELLVDGVSVERHDASETQAGGAETVKFEHRFDKGGPHVLTAKVLCDDEMPSDNTTERIVNVLDRLPVLLVEGDPSKKPLEGAGAFVEIALAPIEESSPAADPAGGQPAPTVAEVPVTLTDVRTVTVADLAGATLRRYAAVLLANVPQAPADVAVSLKQYVQDGGGLLVIGGDRLVPAFYNGWMADSGQPLMPATLLRRKTMAESPAHPSAKTFSHPSLELLADSAHSDIERAIVTACWSVTADTKDSDVRIGAALDSSDPMLLERKVGKGRVIFLPVSMDRQDSNLPSLKCFVPLVHELVYYLASPTVVHNNVKAGAEFVLDLPYKSADIAKQQASTKQPPLIGQAIEVILPTDQKEKSKATVAATPGGMKVSFDGTYEPGLYHLVFPPMAADRYLLPPATRSGVPFAVLNDPEEGRLTALEETDLQGIARHVNLFRAENVGGLVSAVVGNVPGEELWKYLALSLLGALVAEIGLTRWIAQQRRTNVSETVEFGSTAVDVQTFRKHAREILAVPSEQPGSAAKP